MRSLLPLCLFLLACNVTETGNPPFAAQMALTADSSDPAAVSLGGGPAPLVVHEVWVGIGDVRFVRADVCDAPGETEIDVPGPIVTELVAAPHVVSFDLTGNDYCRVRVPLERVAAPPEGAPAELLDHAIVILGERADGTPFRIASRMEREADVRSRGAPFELSEGLRAVVLAFDLALWLGTLDLSAAEVGEDGVIAIDESHNDALLDAFELEVERALRLFRDTDEDGALDVEERAELLAEGA